MNPESIRKTRAVYNYLQRCLLEAPSTDSVIDEDLFITYIFSQLLKNVLDRAEEQS